MICLASSSASSPVRGQSVGSARRLSICATVIFFHLGFVWVMGLACTVQDDIDRKSGGCWRAPSGRAESTDGQVGDRSNATVGQKLRRVIVDSLCKSTVMMKSEADTDIPLCSRKSVQNDLARITNLSEAMDVHDLRTIFVNPWVCGRSEYQTSQWKRATD